LRAEGFSCSLCVFYGGLGIRKIAIFDPKNMKKFSSCNFFTFLVIKTLDPDTGLDPDPQLEKCSIRIRIKSMRIHKPDFGTGKE
jgi:hypothetical protein